jgi:hypothetical protein
VALFIFTHNDDQADEIIESLFRVALHVEVDADRVI